MEISACQLLYHPAESLVRGFLRVIVFMLFSATFFLVALPGFASGRLRFGFVAWARFAGLPAIRPSISPLRRRATNNQGLGFRV